MPTYDYICRGCERDLAVTTSKMDGGPTDMTCGECGEAFRKVFTAPAIKLKGPGFHTTDYTNREKQKRQGRERVESGEAFADLTD